ncbi:hypothetical protein DNTS_016184, partial [Danionella cerebrum]
ESEGREREREKRGGGKREMVGSAKESQQRSDAEEERNRARASALQLSVLIQSQERERESERRESDLVSTLQLLTKHEDKGFSDREGFCLKPIRDGWFHDRAAEDIGVLGSMLDDLIYRRSEYQENCSRALRETPPPLTGVFCNGSFDVFACFPHSAPGIVSVPCPSYLPWIREGASGRVFKECMRSGSWRTEENSTGTWRNQSECENPRFFQSEEEAVFRQSVLRVLSIVGYSLSFSSLCLAVLIMSILRKLHCTRNYIHMNLFVSFILRALAVIIKEGILQAAYSNLPSDETGWNSFTKSAVSLLCKASKVSLEYFVGCNYFWLLVEAVFLHTLLFSAVLTRRRILKKYMLVGWGTPLLFVIPWTFAKIFYENKRLVCFPLSCWMNDLRWIWWIIRGPITLSVLVSRHKIHFSFPGAVIFCIFLKIIRLLLSKLKADQVKFTDYRYSLARATLVLIPLLGVHEILFSLIIDESVEGTQRYARNFIHLTLSSFQVLLLSSNL